MQQISGYNRMGKQAKGKHGKDNIEQRIDEVLEEAINANPIIYKRLDEI